MAANIHRHIFTDARANQIPHGAAAQVMDCKPVVGPALAYT
ncbi:MAG: hypothetical protein ACRD4Y_17390 [Candidatus Acidiferrales bacterium]